MTFKISGCGFIWNLLEGVFREGRLWHGNVFPLRCPSIFPSNWFDPVLFSSYQVFLICFCFQIITKSGRKLFPIMRLKIRGLDPAKMYSVSMDFGQVGQNRYKYAEGGWQSAGKAEPQPTDTAYTHHKSPNYGRFWTKDVVDFAKIKVTNKKSDDMVSEKAKYIGAEFFEIFVFDFLIKVWRTMRIKVLKFGRSGWILCTCTSLDWSFRGSIPRQRTARSSCYKNGWR